MTYDSDDSWLSFAYFLCEDVYRNLYFKSESRCSQKDDFHSILKQSSKQLWKFLQIESNKKQENKSLFQ